MTRQEAAVLLRALAADIEAGKGEYFQLPNGWIVRGDPSLMILNEAQRYTVTAIKRKDCQ